MLLQKIKCFKQYKYNLNIRRTGGKINIPLLYPILYIYQKYPWIQTIGVPLSPLPEVKPEREPIKFSKVF